VLGVSASGRDAGCGREDWEMVVLTIQFAQPCSMTPSNRQLCVDQKFDSHSTVKTSFQNYFFQRLVAKEVTFDGGDFSYTIFDTCYFRKCVFQNCNFTGCRFTSSNFYGSSFNGCKFDYVTFERTIVDSDILDVGCPGHENLKLRFARTLRANFQSLGDATSVNKAIGVELAATMEHYLKAWKSGESYYRNKYKGWARAKMFFAWLNFKLWDYVWGNGESLLKLGRALMVILATMAIADVFLKQKDSLLITSYLKSFIHVPAVFFGIKTPLEYPELYLAIILVVRLIMVGFLLSIIIKRFSRR
jgi:hypothetical protein